MVPKRFPTGEVCEVGEAVAPWGAVPVGRDKAGLDILVGDGVVQQLVVRVCEHLIHKGEELLLGLRVQDGGVVKEGPSLLLEDGGTVPVAFHQVSILVCELEY